MVQDLVALTARRFLTKHRPITSFPLSPSRCTPGPLDDAEALELFAHAANLLEVLANITAAFVYPASQHCASPLAAKLRGSAAGDTFRRLVAPCLARVPNVR